MKLGFLTSCMPERSLEDIAAWAGANGYEALELAAWPHLGDRPFTASHVKADAFDEAEAERVRRALDDNGLVLSALAYYDNNLAADAAEREAYHAHLRACIDAAAALGGVPVGTFIGRDPGRSVAENLREAERVFPPLVDYAGERGVRLMIENCVMEGWHPDGYPGNLAYSPELWEWMFELGLYLNFDPSHLLWLGIDPVDALRPYVDRVAHAHAKDAETFPGRSATATASSAAPRRAKKTRGTWAGGAIASPVSAQVDFRRYVDALYEGGFDGVLSVEHEDPVWGGTPELIEAGLRDRPQQPPRAGGPVTKVLEVRNLVKEFPGVKALQGVDLDVLEAEVHCLLGPERRRQVDADQVRLRRGRADERRDPLPGRAAPAGRSRGLAQARRRDDLPGARPRRRPERRREHLPRARAAPRAAARPRQDVPRLGGAARAARARVDPGAREGRAAAPGRAADRLDRARAVGQRAAADHGRAVRDPRRRRDRRRSSTSFAGSPPRASASSTSRTGSTRSGASATA